MLVSKYYAVYLAKPNSLLEAKQSINCARVRFCDFIIYRVRILRRLSANIKIVNKLLDQYMFPELSKYLDGRLPGGEGNVVDSKDVLELGTFIADMPDRNELLVWMLRDLLESRATEELEQLAGQVLKCGLPDHAELLFVLALAFERVGRNQDGLDCLSKAIELDSSVAMYHNNAGVFYERLGQFARAKDAYAQAMALNPGEALHAINLGKLCINRLDCFEDGIRSYNAALALDLEDVATIQRSAVAYYKYGFVDKAIARMRLAARIAPTNISVIFFKLLLHLAVSYESDDHLLKSREAVVRELDVIHDEVTQALATPGYATQRFTQDGWETLFLLAYQGKNDKEIMQRYSAELARALRPFFPKNISDELPPERAARRSGKIRVGFCTAFFYHHSVWKIPLHGFYKYIDRAKFEIHSFHMGGSVDDITGEVRQLSDSYVRHTDLASMVQSLNDAELDVLIFPELGMDGLTFLLSVMRFAPVQCQALGHPITSGSKTIDFVLSSDLMEPADAQEHYSEALVRLPGLGVTYTYPYEFCAGTKEQFGLSESDVVFFSPQSLFKYLPENDDIYPEIAGRIDNAKFVFIASAVQEGRKEFETRLRFAFERRGLDFDLHVAFIPGQGKTGFMQACNMADLFIDNPSWSGHNTVLDALHSRTPVVSMWGDAMRKNHGAAILTRVGLDDFVAETRSEFVEKCVFLSRSLKHRATFEPLITSRLKNIQDRSPVDALEVFLTGET